MSLLQQILEIEPKAKLLEPDAHTRQNWLNRVSHYAHQFIDELPANPAYRPAQNLDAYFSISQQAVATDEILQHLQSGMLAQGLNPASGGHLGYIPGGGLYAGALGDYLAAVTNQYAGMYYAGPGAVKMENELIRWLCRMMGYPPTAHGNLTSGGSIANLIALVTAREAFELRSADIPRQVLYFTDQVHHSMHKAVRIAGLAEAQSRCVPMTKNFRMDVQALELQIQRDVHDGYHPFFIVASAGTTDTGAVDPLLEIAELASNHGVWFHVDAAYGGFFKCLSNDPSSKLLAGIEKSDSLAIDPHKGLFLSYGLGSVLVKNTGALYKAHYYKASYMQDTLEAPGEWNPADLSPELTKHFRGLRLYMALQWHGFEPFKAALQEKLWLCRYFYHEVQRIGFTVGPYPDLSVCIYRFERPGCDLAALNKSIVDHVIKKGRVFLSTTNIGGEYWIRLAVLSFRTHLQEINWCLEDLEEGLAWIMRS